MSLLPAIADHDTICTDINIKPIYTRQRRRPIYSFHKADWTDIKKVIKKACSDIIKSDKDVEGKWTDFKSAINEILETKIPKKLSPKLRQLPWLSKDKE